MSKKILIAEDEALITSTISALLETMNTDYVVVKDGKDALKKFKEENFDLVITDIFMPNVDGFQLIEEIRKSSKKVPVLVISGYIDNETIRKIKDIGADAYIEKPFSLKDVKDIIGRLLGV